MLLNSVIIVLREVLEASLLISLMLLLSNMLKLSLSWLTWAVGAGLLGAFVYAHTLVFISDWFEGVGQEVVNALLQTLIYLLLAGFCIRLVNSHKMPKTPFSLSIMRWVMAVCISLSMIREFSEIIIYLQVFSPTEQGFSSVVIGASLGVGIGLSISVIFYYALDYINNHRSNYIIIIILAFLAAGMLLQATQLLIQADWLPSQQPLWDSSAWIAEQSMVGQLLYAVFGYEATPSLLEVAIYGVGLFIILFFIMRQLGREWLNKNHHTDASSLHLH
jgi:high-affinity iron transporter